MTIDQLPTFTISRLNRDRAIGSFDRTLWMGEGYLGDLLLPDRFIRGRFVNVDLHSLSATFIPASAEDVGVLLAGATYPRFDAYWGQRALLVLGRKRIWTQRTFAPRDAIAYKGADSTVVAEATRPNLPESGTVIKDGWDHEHCELCWEKISPWTDPVAMFSVPNHWICRACHKNFVVPRSLDFIYVDTAETPSTGG